jgi:2-methylcitrate dehydratase PrpD
MTTLAERLAEWAVSFEPSAQDAALARRALVDTVAVALAGAQEPATRIAASEDTTVHWATAAHALDYDDLHIESTAHLSAVCVPATLAVSGGARAYLAGAGVMARLGRALGWAHYSRGWHATCTAGAPGAAVAAGIGAGLDARRLATAIALAVPAAGGVQAAFGTQAKPLQVGFAAAAGVRAARLAAKGAEADPAALEQLVQLLGGTCDVDFEGPAIPGGLAVKVYPCCYALQRPIAAAQTLHVEADEVESIECRTPRPALQPLNRHRPRTGLEGKFSLEYGLAAALLDRPPGFASFTDEAVCRPEAQRLVGLVSVDAESEGDALLNGGFEVTVRLSGGRELRAELDLPPGSPQRPPTEAELAAKVEDCCGPVAPEVKAVTWEAAPEVLRRLLL